MSITTIVPYTLLAMVGAFVDPWSLWSMVVQKLPQNMPRWVNLFSPVSISQSMDFPCYPGFHDSTRSRLNPIWGFTDDLLWFDLASQRWYSNIWRLLAQGSCWVSWRQWRKWHIYRLIRIWHHSSYNSPRNRAIHPPWRRRRPHTVSSSQSVST